VLAVPYFGYACVGVTGFVYWRVGDRRRSKYRQMRRTAGAAQRAAAASASAEAAEPPPAPAAVQPGSPAGEVPVAAGPTTSDKPGVKEPAGGGADER
jgi:hypothetical protein